MRPWAQDVPLLAVVVPDTVATDMRLIGELDLSTIAVLATLIEQQIATGHLDVQIDLSDLAFCDVRCLRGLLEGRLRLAAAGGRLTLAAPRPMLSRVAVVIGVAVALGWKIEPAPAWTG